MLWGAAVAIALGSTAGVANVVVVKSLGPSAKSYPPGKTLAGKRQDHPSGRRRRDRDRPEQRADAARSGQFRRQAGDARLGRGPARPLRRASRRRSRAQSRASGTSTSSQSGKICVTDASKLQLWRPDSETAATVKIRAADGKIAAPELGGGQGADRRGRPRCRSRTARAIRSNGPTAARRAASISSPCRAPPADLVGAAQVLIENGCQKQLDLLVESASKAGK